MCISERSQSGLISMVGKAERGPTAIEAIKKHKSAYLICLGVVWSEMFISFRHKMVDGGVFVLDGIGVRRQIVDGLYRNGHIVI